MVQSGVRLSINMGTFHNQKSELQNLVTCTPLDPRVAAFLTTFSDLWVEVDIHMENGNGSSYHLFDLQVTIRNLVLAMSVITFTHI